MCCVYTLDDSEKNWYGNIFCNPSSLWPHPLFTKIHNKSKDLKWIYVPSCFGILEVDEDLIWLSHWKLFGSQLEGGDAVSVSIVMEGGGGGFEVKECGINLVYYKQLQGNNTCPYSPYVVGGDLSEYLLPMRSCNIRGL